MTTQISRRAIARSVLAGIAAVPVASLPAIAAVDPAFAVIEKLKAAHTYHGECLVRADDIEQKIWARQKAGIAVPRKDWDEVDALRDSGCYTEEQARTAFLATRPTSQAGAAAMTTFFMENYNRNGLDCFWEDHIEMLIWTIDDYLRKG